MTDLTPIDRLKTSALGCFLRTSPSLAKILFNPAFPLAKKSAAVNFFLNGSGAERLIASLPRAGYHYLNLMNDVALDLEAGGTGKFHFDYGWFHSAGGHHGVALDWRWKLGTGAFNPSPPVILNTHLPYYLNSCLTIGRMKTVIMVRNMWDVLESLIHLNELTPELYDPFLYSRPHPDMKPHVKMDFPFLIKFFNTWGAVADRDNVMIMHFGDLTQNPEKELRRFRSFMELDISDTNLDRAVALCHKNNMRKVIGQPEKRVVRVRFSRQSVHFNDTQTAHIQESLLNSRYQDLGCSMEPSDPAITNTA